jgi:hypothetical protein
MLGGAREFRYDWILLGARDLPHEAGGTPAPIILRGDKRHRGAPCAMSAARRFLNTAMISRRFPPPWSAELTPKCYIVRTAVGLRIFRE